MDFRQSVMTRAINLAGDPPFALDRPRRPLNYSAGALIALPVETTIRGLTLGGKMLSALLPAAGSRRLGVCVACGAPVSESDPFIRYRGDYYHAHGCVETNPPALRRRQVRASPTNS